MGWTQEPSSRAEVVKAHAAKRSFPGGVTREAIKQARHGVEDWFLFRVTNTDGVRSRYIEVMVWDGTWHKEMSEECGPYYYGCPPEWFLEVACPSSLADKWRTAVVSRQANASAMAAAAHMLEWKQRIDSGKAPL